MMKLHQNVPYNGEAQCNPATLTACFSKRVTFEKRIGGETNARLCFRAKNRADVLPLYLMSEIRQKRQRDSCKLLNYDFERAFQMGKNGPRF
jgi:hypothetical protein